MTIRRKVILLYDSGLREPSTLAGLSCVAAGASETAQVCASPTRKDVRVILRDSAICSDREHGLENIRC